MFSVDTPKVIRDRVFADIESRLDSDEPLLPVGLLNIIAWIVAGVAFAIYGTIAWVSRKALPGSVEPDEEVVAAWANAFGIPRLDAVAASGEILLTGTDGGVAPAGSLWVAPAGQQYELDADATIAAGVAIASVTALEPGISGNLEAGFTLTALVPIVDVNSSATVGAAGLAGGADIESISAWDARILERLRNPPQGGSLADYERWAREAHPAVTHVWIDENGYGPGSVVVRCMTYGATPNGIPELVVLDAVFDYIEERRPVGMNGLLVPAPIPVPVDLTFASVTPDTLAVRNAIEAEIAALIVREARTGGTIPLSHFDEAASLAEDEEDHAFVPGTVIPSCAPGEILVPGTITWI